VKWNAAAPSYATLSFFDLGVPSHYATTKIFHYPREGVQAIARCKRVCRREIKSDQITNYRYTFDIYNINKRYRVLRERSLKKTFYPIEREL